MLKQFKTVYNVKKYARKPCRTNTFVRLKLVYVHGTTNANERWRMPSFAFGSVPSDVSN